MVNVQYTFAYAAVLALLYVALSVRVISHRVKTKVLLGDGSNQGLSAAIRTHANFGEYVPLALILIYGVEAFNYPAYFVHILGGVLVLARLIHVHGIASKGAAGLGRPVGTILTLSILVSGSVLVLVKIFA